MAHRLSQKDTVLTKVELARPIRESAVFDPIDVAAHLL
jgi:hypothetical protein